MPHTLCRKRNLWHVERSDTLRVCGSEIVKTRLSSCRRWGYCVEGAGLDLEQDEMTWTEV